MFRFRGLVIGSGPGIFNSLMFHKVTKKQMAVVKMVGDQPIKSGQQECGIYYCGYYGYGSGHTFLWG